MKYACNRQFGPASRREPVVLAGHAAVAADRPKNRDDVLLLGATLKAMLQAMPKRK
jgi:hypothetical protein